MSSRWTGFVVWALVAASIAFWGLRVTAAARPLPPTAQTPGTPVFAQGPMTHLFGALVVPTQAQAHPASERFQLFGVVLPGHGTDTALALVSVDGQPARPWHVGATVDGDTQLLAVSRRSADFGPSGGPKAFTLDLPEPVAPATGTLPGVSSGPGRSPTSTLPVAGAANPAAGGPGPWRPAGLNAPAGSQGAAGVAAPGTYPESAAPSVISSSDWSRRHRRPAPVGQEPAIGQAPQTAGTPGP